MQTYTSLGRGKLQEQYVEVTQQLFNCGKGGLPWREIVVTAWRENGLYPSDGRRKVHGVRTLGDGRR
jgi:hypothetical protein